MKRKSVQFMVVQLMTLATFTLFVSLGSWQLSRGNIKNDIESANINQQDTYRQPGLPLQDLESWRYRKISLVGVYDNTRQFLLDNQVRDRITGYNVLTPLYVEQQDAWVLVDRGWIPQAESRAILPEVSMPSEELLKVSGRAYVPYDKAFSLGGIADGEDRGWPRRIQFVDYRQLGERLGVRLEPFTLRLATDQENGYRRDWIESSLSAQKHYGYAFQWYAMALALLVLWWLYSIKPLIKKNEQRKF